MKIDRERGFIFDNLLDGDKEFGGESVAITSAYAPAEQAVAGNAIGEFAERAVTQTNKNAREFGALIRSTFA